MAGMSAHYRRTSPSASFKLSLTTHLVLFKQYDHGVGVPVDPLVQVVLSASY